MNYYGLINLTLLRTEQPRNREIQIQWIVLVAQPKRSYTLFRITEFMPFLRNEQPRSREMSLVLRMSEGGPADTSISRHIASDGVNIPVCATELYVCAPLFLLIVTTIWRRMRDCYLNTSQARGHSSLLARPRLPIDLFGGIEREEESLQRDNAGFSVK